LKLDIDYPGLKKTLLYLKKQAQESIPFMDRFIPNSITTPEALFYFLKARTKFKSDPKGIEHIKTAQTLFSKYGGRGDCDCLTVAALAALYNVLPGAKLYINLTGRNRKTPSHIYVSFDYKGLHHYFDLTNPWYDFERTKNYRYKQQIPINL
jgi:hypothetical protein